MRPLNPIEPTHCERSLFPNPPSKRVFSCFDGALMNFQEITPWATLVVTAVAEALCALAYINGMFNAMRRETTAAIENLRRQTEATQSHDRHDQRNEVTRITAAFYAADLKLEQDITRVADVSERRLKDSLDGLSDVMRNFESRFDTAIAGLRQDIRQISARSE
jgi:hypothetical protein